MAINAVPRASVEYICQKNTVSTNPDEHKYHDKFIQFMDDPEISDFGRWQFSNGFNTALVAVQCDLDKAPSIEPEQRWIPVSEKLPEANGRYLVTRGLRAAGALWNRVYIANYSDLMGLKSEKIWWEGNVGKSDFKPIDDVIAWMPLPEQKKGGETMNA